MTMIHTCIAIYALTLILNYLLLRRSYIRTKYMPFPFIMVSIIPIVNIAILATLTYLEIKETVKYDKFLDFIFNNKNK